MERGGYFRSKKNGPKAFTLCSILIVNNHTNH